MTTASPPPTSSEQPCRHEYVRIFQHKLKGLERRLLCMKAWNPVGFKMADFSHLGEGSYCFCSNCRTRLFPKRTNADRAQARLALAAAKQAQAEAAEQDLLLAEETEEQESEAAHTKDIHVEELEVESVELEDLEQGAVAIDQDGGCQTAADDS